MLQAELPVLPSNPAPAGVSPPDMQGAETPENGGFMVLLALELAAFAPVGPEAAGEAGAALPIVDGNPGGKDLPVALPPIAGPASDEMMVAADGEAEQPLDAVPPVPPAAFPLAPVMQNEPDAVLETVARGRRPLPQLTNPQLTNPPRTELAPAGPVPPAQTPAATPRPEMPAIRLVDAPPAAERPVSSAGKTLAPPVAVDAPVPSPSLGADLAVQAPAVACQPQAAASPLPSAAPMPRDIATLIDRLVEARDGAASQAGGATVAATLAHAQFGRVAMQLRPDDGGLTVAMTSGDPGFAPAAQAAVAASAQSAPAEDGRGSQPRPDQQQSPAGQQPGSHSPSSQARQSGTGRTAPEREGQVSDEADPRRDNGIYA
ncbi:MAG: hypothetical protein M0R03_09730 [Novosphingobium sp.]|nr:hypothetical protein [Novosphingobium sp.]